MKGVRFGGNPSESRVPVSYSSPHLVCGPAPQQKFSAHDRHVLNVAKGSPFDVLLLSSGSGWTRLSMSTDLLLLHLTP